MTSKELKAKKEAEAATAKAAEATKVVTPKRTRIAHAVRFIIDKGTTCPTKIGTAFATENDSKLNIKESKYAVRCSMQVLRELGMIEEQVKVIVKAAPVVEVKKEVVTNDSK